MKCCCHRRRRRHHEQSMIKTRQTDLSRFFMCNYSTPETKRWIDLRKNKLCKWLNLHLAEMRTPVVSAKMRTKNEIRTQSHDWAHTQCCFNSINKLGGCIFLLRVLTQFSIPCSFKPIHINIVLRINKNETRPKQSNTRSFTNSRSQFKLYSKILWSGIKYKIHLCISMIINAIVHSTCAISTV